VSAAERVSAGILLFRRGRGSIELLLAHPGGPLFARRDEGSWTIPKGEVEGESAPAVEDDAGRGLVAVARREFAEETGHGVPAGTLIPLGWVRQKGGKRVHAWAVEGDLDPAAAVSNTFEMEWPPRSGSVQRFPEIDRVAWFGVEESRRRLKERQGPFIERLIAHLEGHQATS
jgi:predicted NUDIX family NTP pyrophosphohydrolase